MVKRKIIPLILILVGVAFLLGAIISWVDNLTATESVGLGKWIFDFLVALIGASSGVRGWLDWNKKETPSQVTNITASESGQVATGEHGRNIRQGDNSHYIENFHEALKPEKAFSPLHQLPQPPADFTGRKELIEQLLSDLNSRKGATISGLTGMGGIGKTALALEVAHKIAENYPDAQIYLDLKGTTTPLSTLDIARHVILSFEPTIDFSVLDETNIFAAYQSVLHGKKALLLFDNARSAEQIMPLRPPEACAILVTSRWVFSVPGLQTHRVGVMNEEDAKDFLLELCPRIGDKAAELAKACAYLPLALRIAGSFLGVNSEWSIENYLTQLNDRKGRLATLKESRKGAELLTEPDLLATFELSYNALSEENQKRWRALGVFPASFAPDAAGAMWELGEYETTKALGLFKRYSLLENDMTTNRYSLHDLMSDFSQGKMTKSEYTLSLITHSKYYANLLSDINESLQKGGESILQSLKIYDSEWINIEFGQNTSFVYAAKLCNLYAWQSSVNSLRLNPKVHIQWIENAQKALEVSGNESKGIQAIYLNQLAIINLDLGDARKSIALSERSLAIARELDEGKIESNALGSLGGAYLKLGEYRKAIAFYEQQLALVKRIELRSGEANSLNNIGIAYADLGEMGKAIEYYEQSLLIKREIGDRRGEGNSLGNLGNAYRVLGNIPKAIDVHEQRLNIARELGDRIGEERAMSNLGLSYMFVNDANRAVTLYEESLAIARELGDREGEGNNLYNLGIALHNTIAN